MLTVDDERVMVRAHRLLAEQPVASGTADAL
jgi:hypothetical protein